MSLQPIWLTASLVVRRWLQGLKCKLSALLLCPNRQTEKALFRLRLVRCRRRNLAKRFLTLATSLPVAARTALRDVPNLATLPLSS